MPGTFRDPCHPPGALCTCGFALMSVWLALCSPLRVTPPLPGPLLSSPAFTLGDPQLPGRCSPSCGPLQGPSPALLAALPPALVGACPWLDSEPAATLLGHPSCPMSPSPPHPSCGRFHTQTHGHRPLFVNTGTSSGQNPTWTSSTCLLPAARHPQGKWCHSKPRPWAGARPSTLATAARVSHQLALPPPAAALSSLLHSPQDPLPPLPCPPAGPLAPMCMRNQLTPLYLAKLPAPGFRVHLLTPFQ